MTTRNSTAITTRTRRPDGPKPTPPKPPPKPPPPPPQPPPWPPPPPLARAVVGRPSRPPSRSRVSRAQRTHRPSRGGVVIGSSAARRRLEVRAAVRAEPGPGGALCPALGTGQRGRRLQALAAVGAEPGVGGVPRAAVAACD